MSILIITMKILYQQYPNKYLFLKTINNKHINNNYLLSKFINLIKII